MKERSRQGRRSPRFLGSKEMTMVMVVIMIIVMTARKPVSAEPAAA